MRVSDGLYLRQGQHPFRDHFVEHGDDGSKRLFILDHGERYETTVR